MGGSDCTDDVLAGLLDSVSEFGYRRVAERDLPRALRFLDAADATALTGAVAKALNLVDFAVDRETGAVRSTEDVYSASAAAKTAVSDRLRQWELYRAALRGQIDGYAKVRAATLGATYLLPGSRATRAARPLPRSCRR